MTDKVKLILIEKMIAEFFEYSSEEQIRNGSATMLDAVYTVVGFKEKVG